MNLSDVSKTAIVTLICRAMGSDKQLIDDPMASTLLVNLKKMSSKKELVWVNRIERMFSGKGGLEGIKTIIDRARYFDEMVSTYVQNNPSCTVISLGCGFDTRYWRTESGSFRYIELDLPGLIDVKREMLGDSAPYELIGCSVVDQSWIAKANAIFGNNRCLVVAEGLFMYLSESQAREILGTIAENFEDSEILVELADIKYVRGISGLISKTLGTALYGIDMSFSFGISSPRVLEEISKNYRNLQFKRGSTGYFVHASIDANIVTEKSTET